MLPVVVAAAQGEAVLGPDDLGADVEARGLQDSCTVAGVAAGVPDVGDVPGNSAQASRQSARSSLATLPSLLRVVVHAGRACARPGRSSTP